MMPDKEKVICQLEKMRDYHRSVGNNITADIANDALELIDTQYKLILELQNLISIGTKMMNGGEA